MIQQQKGTLVLDPFTLEFLGTGKGSYDSTPELPGLGLLYFFHSHEDTLGLSCLRTSRDGLSQPGPCLVLFQPQLFLAATLLALEGPGGSSWPSVVADCGPTPRGQKAWLRSARGCREGSRP